jgi:hypothetical protein
LNSSATNSDSHRNKGLTGSRSWSAPRGMITS